MRRAVPRRVPAGSSVSRRLLPSPKKCALSLAISGLILSEIAAAGPEGGKVVGGAGNISHAGNTTTINQNTDRLAIDWQSFDVGSDERVNFIQPGSSSVALNRILSNYGSQINGRIDANGHVVLVNPNGIVFGAGSVINAGGILASGLSIDPADFMNGDYTFKAIEGTDGVVINSGLINASTGGNVALIGKQVENQGLITAQLGSVTLAAGKEAVVTFEAGGILGVRVSQAVLQDDIGVDAAVINSGEIKAEDGQILLSASVSQDIFSQAVNAGGLSDARSVVVHDDGSFTLGAGADVVNTGDLNVSGDSAGDIVVLGENVTSSGRILADNLLDNASQSNSGGAIEIHSQDTTLLTQDSLTSATASNGKGGDIKVLGDKVGLTDNANLTASGVNGGGQILVGGDRTGDNPLVRNAEFIYLGEETNISADALINGDGGRVITFANNTARIYGDLSARGGALSGNGGFIETSGLLGFEILNAPDISAVLGRGGEWLIDPHNITINNDGANERISSDTPFIASADNAILDVDILRTALGSNSTVTIQTADPAMGSSEEGNITFDTNLNYTGNSDSTLILNAHGNINTNGRTIASSNSALSLQFDANFDGSSGHIALGSSTISTNGGSITLTGDDIGGTFILDPMTSNVIGVTGSASGDITTSGGLFTINATGDVMSSNAIVTTQSDLQDAGDITVTAGSFTSTGSIDVTSRRGDDNILINTTGNTTLNTIEMGESGSIDTGDTVNNSSLTINAQTINLNGNITYGINSPNNDHTVAINLDARSAINIGSVTIDSDSATDILNFSLTADSDNTNDDGVISIASGAQIITQGGNFTVAGADSFSSSGTIDVSSFAGDGDIAITTDGNTTLAAIEIGERGNNDMSVGEVASSSLTVNAQTINLNGNIVYGENGAASTHTVNVGLTANDAINFTGINVDNSGGNDVLNMTLDAGGDITIAASGSDGNNIWLTGGNFTVASARNFTIGNAAVPSDRRDFVGTEGGNITIGTSGTPITGDFNSNFDNALLFTYLSTTQTGDINIHADGDIDLGALDANGFQSWNYNGSDPVNITIAAGDDLTFHRDFNFERVTGTGTNTFNFSAGNAVIPGTPTADQSASEIRVLGNINSSSDVADITFASNFNRDTTFTLDGTGSNTGEFDTSGSNLTITLNDSVTLNGSILVNEITVRTDGLIQQTDAAGTLVNNSNAIFNTDRDNSSNPFDILLTGDNDFNSQSLIIEAANNVTLNDIDRLLIGGASASSTIFGNLIATSNESSGEGITDRGSVTVMGAASLNARGLSIDLTQTNFMGEVSVDTSGNNSTQTGGDVTISGSDNIILGSVNTSGRDSDDNAGNITVTVNNSFTANGAITATGSNNSGAGSDFIVNGDGSDNTFTIGAGAMWSGNDFTINGLGGTGDTLIGPDQIAPNFNDWQITSADTGSLNSDFGFTGIENLTGGTGQDTFVFSDGASLSGVIDGAGTADGDSVNFAAVATAVTARLSNLLNIESITGNANTASILVGADRDNTWNITGTNSGNLDGQNISFTSFNNITGGNQDDGFVFDAGGMGSINGTIDGAGQAGSDTIDYSSVTAAVTANLNRISNIEVITGNGNTASTLVGEDRDNTWNITGPNSGNLDGQNISFTSFNNITGGSQDDDFVFNVNNVTAIGGTIDGAAQSNRDTINYSNIVGDITVLITSLNDIERVIGNSTTPGSNSTLQGGNGTNVWTIDGINEGDLNGFAFEGFSMLTGGNGVDTFFFEDGGSITSANAGSQSGTDEDVVNLSRLNSNVDVSVGTTIFGVTDFERVIGNNDGTGANNSTLRGTDIANTWVIGEASDPVNDGINDGNVNGTFAFTNFNNLVGGTANDAFTISDGADITGTVDGGGTMDTDTMNFAAVTGAVSVMASDFTNIERVVGNNTNSTLTGANDPNTWTITAQNTGDLNGFEFVNFNHLVGNNGEDTFIFTTATSDISGSVDAGGGAAQDTVNLSALANITINAADADIFGVTNAERVIGNGTTSRLNGADAVNTWTITGENDGDINDLLFEDFNTLVGGDNDDTFVFMNAMSSVTSANAGGQAMGTNGDTVDLQNLVTIGTITVSSTIRGVSNIEHVIGNNSTGVLTGDDVTNTWTINNANTGSVDFGGTSPLTFAQFDQLQGGGRDDTFIYMDAGSISGSVDAGLQASRDTVDLSNRTDAINENVGTTIFDVTGVERVIGNNVNSTLNGANNDNTWNITGVNDGNVNGTDLIFENFNHLVGGSADDTFIFANTTSIVETIDGRGDGALGDTANYSNVTMATVDITLGAAGISNIETLIGNGTDSFLRAQNLANTWTINGTNEGTVENSASGTISFSDFTDLMGGDNDDTFIYMTGGTINGSVDAGDQASRDTVDVSNLMNTSVIQTDSTLFGVSGVEHLVGNNTETTLTAVNQTNTWNINGVNDGALVNSNGPLTFVNVGNLTGGSQDDSFTIEAIGSVAGRIDGSGQSNLDSVTYVSFQEITLDTNLINIEQITTNTDSILRADNRVNDWVIDNENTGTINNIRFVGFDRLFGGANDDTFEFTSSGRITGSIDAGDQNNQDTVNLAALSSVNITLGSNINGVSNVERIIGNGSQSSLTAASGDNVWTITGENDGSIAGAANIEFVDFNNLFGNSGDDIFNFDAMGEITGTINGGLQSTQDTINYAAVASVDITIGSDFTDIERVEGRGISSTLRAENRGNNWIIDGVNEGTINSDLRFVGFNFLVGNDQQDNFTLSGGSISGSIDGGLDTDTLTADVGNNVWDITGAFDGSVTDVNATSFLNIDALIGNSGTDTFDINQAYSGRIEGGGDVDTFNLRADVTGLIEGNDGDDQFNIFVDGLTASINGNGGTDSITIDHTSESDWAIQSGSSTVDNVSFNGIEIANGNNSVDTVVISTNFGEINTAGGADSITIDTTNAITTSINAGGGNDTLTSLNTVNTWLIGTNNTLNTSISFTDVQNFVGGDFVDNFTLQSGSIIGSINGGGNTDSLTVNSVSGDTVAWNITGNNVGTVTGIGGTFTSIENITGGEGTDTFTFTDSSSSVSGLIDGGGSVADSLNLSVLTSGVVVELGSTVTSSNPDTSNTLTNLHVNNIETLTAANDANEADGNDTEVNNWLTVSDNINLTWTVTERNGGRVFPTSNPTAENTVNFANFGTIIGGDGNDEDVFGLDGANAEITGSIDGGGGTNNRLDFSRVVDLLVVTIGEAISDTLTISNIQGVTGNDNAILRINGGDERTNTWAINGINSGVVNDSDSSRRFTFSAFNNLVGGGGQDLFNFTGAGNITGTINGGGIVGGSGFVDTINALASTENLQVQLSQITQAMLGDGSSIDVVLDNSDESIDIFGIGSVTGGATQTNTFVGQSAAANTWLVNGQNAGEVNGVVFNNFSNLTGGSAQDVFTLNNTDSITGTIDGGAGNNDRLDITGLNGDASVALGVENVGDLNVLAIEDIDANTANSNTIIGENSVNRWVINGTNDGQLGSVAFTGFANLTGGNLNDTFVLDAGDNITGVIDGGADPATGSATDELNITGLTDNVIVALASGIAADINATRFENINANTTNNNTIAAANTQNAWQINAQNGGVINDAVTFVGFGNLQGGSENDTFAYLDGGSISGGVDGGSQAAGGRDVVDMSAQASVRIRIGDPTQGFVNIEEFRGNDSDSELTAANVRNDWVLNSGNNSGVINADINFTGFNILIGGSDVDNFDVANGSVSGEIRAGAGNDTLTVAISDGASGNVSFVGNDGSDTVTVTGGSADERYTTNYGVSTTNGRSTLEYTRNSASSVTTYNVNYTESETIVDQVFSDQLVVNDVDGQVDTFNLADGSFSLNSFAQVDYQNKENVRVQAETGDVVNVNGPVQIANVFELVNASVNAVGADAQIQAAEVIFNGTDAIGSASDRLSLNTGRLSLQTVAGDVFISEENDLQITSILNPTGIVDIEAGGTISDDGVLASNQAVTLTSAVGNIILDNANNFAGAVNLSAAQGNVSLNNNRATQLGNVNAQTLTVTSAGIISDSGAIQVSGLTTINAGNNAVELDSSANDFGSIVVENANQLTLNDINDIIIRQSNSTGAFNVQSGGVITTDGAIQAANILLASNNGMIDVGSQLMAQNSIVLNGQGVTVNGNIETQQSNGTNAIAINAGGGAALVNGQINAAGTTLGDITIEGAQITQQGGSVISGRDVNLTSATGIEQNGNINSSQTVQVVANNGDINVAASSATQGSTVNLTADSGNVVTGQITAAQLNIQSANGNVNVAANTTVSNEAVINSRSAQINGDVNVTGNLGLTTSEATQLQSNVQAGQVNITAGQGITMSEGSTVTGNESINFTANNDIVLSQLSANTGDVTLVSETGKIDSLVGSQTNISATNLTVTTEAGVGSTTDSLGLSVANLTLNNNTGSVTLTNDQEIRIVQLRSNSNVSFTNTTGDFVLDNTPDEPYLYEGTNDARVAGGVANANFDVGILSLTVAEGAVRAIGPLNTLQPDLVGNTVVVSSQGFGVNGRPIVVLAQEELIVNSLIGFTPIFANGIEPNVPFRPGNLTDLSTLVQGRNDLLVNVEAAEEIDPAVFTGVRNYSYDNVSIRLPRDQLFDDEELDEEEEDSFL